MPQGYGSKQEPQRYSSKLEPEGYSSRQEPQRYSAKRTPEGEHSVRELVGILSEVGLIIRCYAHLGANQAHNLMLNVPGGIISGVGLKI